uniref:Uncharacterized threonine-rich GPI-anchored glycoprotein PJ4664.02-like n=1 Tax=Saccoglossus kowalevskii TaxID=10224 RepID=A0ABM0M884_SACKO|nr:PREDICTED: uncharacterized threonine-rich GPI-anchored glycoprotein PJ4664.02-like [Saccoglossus kowalevskii]
MKILLISMLALLLVVAMCNAGKRGNSSGHKHKDSKNKPGSNSVSTSKENRGSGSNKNKDSGSDSDKNKDSGSDSDKNKDSGSSSSSSSSGSSSRSDSDSGEQEEIITGPLCDCMDFKFFSNKKSWFDAKASCEDNLGRLAIVTNEELQAMIENQLQSNTLESGLWVGLSDVDIESEFIWDDGTKICYSNWADWAPATDGNDTDCVMIRGDNYQWQDADCYEPRGYICEFPALDIITRPIIKQSVPSPVERILNSRAVSNSINIANEATNQETVTILPTRSLQSTIDFIASDLPTAVELTPSSLFSTSMELESVSSTVTAVLSTQPTPELSSSILEALLSASATKIHPTFTQSVIQLSSSEGLQLSPSLSQMESSTGVESIIEPSTTFLLSPSAVSLPSSMESIPTSVVSMSDIVQASSTVKELTSLGTVVSTESISSPASYSFFEPTASGISSLVVEPSLLLSDSISLSNILSPTYSSQDVWTASDSYVASDSMVSTVLVSSFDLYPSVLTELASMSVISQTPDLSTTFTMFSESIILPTMSLEVSESNIITTVPSSIIKPTTWMTNSFIAPSESFTTESELSSMIPTISAMDSESEIFTIQPSSIIPSEFMTTEFVLSTVSMSPEVSESEFFTIIPTSIIPSFSEIMDASSVIIPTERFSSVLVPSESLTTESVLYTQSMSPEVSESELFTIIPTSTVPSSSETIDTSSVIIPTESFSSVLVPSESFTTESVLSTPSMSPAFSESELFTVIVPSSSETIDTSSVIISTASFSSVLVPSESLMTESVLYTQSMSPEVSESELFTIIPTSTVPSSSEIIDTSSVIISTESFSSVLVPRESLMTESVLYSQSMSPEVTESELFTIIPTSIVPSSSETIDVSSVIIPTESFSSVLVPSESLMTESVLSTPSMSPSVSESELFTIIPTSIVPSSSETIDASSVTIPTASFSSILVPSESFTTESVLSTPSMSPAFSESELFTIIVPSSSETIDTSSVIISTASFSSVLVPSESLMTESVLYTQSMSPEFSESELFTIIPTSIVPSSSKTMDTSSVIIPTASFSSVLVPSESFTTESVFSTPSMSPAVSESELFTIIPTSIVPFSSETIGASSVIIPTASFSSVLIPSESLTTESVLYTPSMSPEVSESELFTIIPTSIVPSSSETIIATASFSSVSIPSESLTTESVLYTPSMSPEVSASEFLTIIPTSTVPSSSETIDASSLTISSESISTLIVPSDSVLPTRVMFSSITELLSSIRPSKSLDISESELFTIHPSSIVPSSIETIDTSAVISPTESFSSGIGQSPVTSSSVSSGSLATFTMTTILPTILPTSVAASLTPSVSLESTSVLQSSMISTLTVSPSVVETESLSPISLKSTSVVMTTSVAISTSWLPTSSFPSTSSLITPSPSFSPTVQPTSITPSPVPPDEYILTMQIRIINGEPNDTTTWEKVENDLAILYDRGKQNLMIESSRRKRDVENNSSVMRDIFKVEYLNDYNASHLIGTKFSETEAFALKTLYDGTWNNLQYSEEIRHRREAGDNTTPAPVDTEVTITDLTPLGDDEFEVLFYVVDDGTPVPATKATEAYATMTTEEMSATLGQEVTASPTPYLQEETDNTLWIIIGVVAGVILLIIIIIIIYCCWKKKCCKSGKDEIASDSKTKTQKKGMTDKTTSIDMAGLRIDIERGEIITTSTNLNKHKPKTNGHVQETSIDKEFLEDANAIPKMDRTDKISLISESGDGDSLSIKARRIEDMPADRRPRSYGGLTTPVKLVSSYESLSSLVSMEQEGPDRDAGLFTHVALMNKIDEDAEGKTPPVRFKPSLQPEEDGMLNLANLPSLQQTPLVMSMDDDTKQIRMMKAAGVPKIWYKTKKDLDPEQLKEEIEKWKLKRKEKEKLRKEKEKKRAERRKRREQGLQGVDNPSREIEREAWLAAQPELEAILGEDPSPATKKYLRRMQESHSDRWKKHPHKAMPSTTIPNAEAPQFNVKKLGRNMRAKPNKVSADTVAQPGQENVQLLNVRPIGTIPREGAYWGETVDVPVYAAVPMQSDYAWMPQVTDLGGSQQLPQQYMQQPLPQQYMQQEIPLQQMPQQMQQQLFQPVDTHPIYQEQLELQRLQDEMENQRRREQEKAEINRLLDEAFSLTNTPLPISQGFSPSSGIDISPRSGSSGIAPGIILDPASLERTPKNPSMIPGAVSTGNIFPNQIGSLPRSGSYSDNNFSHQFGMPTTDVGYTPLGSVPRQSMFPHQQQSQNIFPVQQSPMLQRHQPLIQPQPQYGTAAPQNVSQGLAGRRSLNPGAEQLERENASLSEQLRLQRLQLDNTLSELGQAQSRLQHLGEGSSSRDSPLSHLSRLQRKVAPAASLYRPEELAGPAEGWSTTKGHRGPDGRTSLTDSIISSSQPHGSGSTRHQSAERQRSPVSSKGDDVITDGQEGSGRSRSSSSGKEPHLTSASIPGVSSSDTLTREQREAIIQGMKNYEV